DRIAEIKHTTGLPVIKAIKVRNRQDVDEATAFEETADIILFDARAPDNQVDALPGGNGIRFDWSLLSSANPPENFMLSGGLNPDNIANAVTATNAAYFDVSSGVELSPGEKDLTAIKKFIVALRNAG
ncbi:MAG TPA: N-(5'-phosphoribosyl)anthranilate isomerase, partial [Rhizobiales bacterium]|nr:N-(5'-phosphoribosyl)anthranilate isomerase [Hyphomicrobiales bacterium]